MTNYDLTIIGGGPVGMFAGYFAALHGLNTMILETLPSLGGQPEALYPAKIIKDIPGFAGISGKDLINNLQNQLNQSSTKVKTSYEVKTIVQDAAKQFIINDELKTKSIIIATGAGAFTPREIPFQYESSLNEHIHYFIKDPEIFENKEIAILGGGDSALDWAVLLSKFAKNISIIHRRDRFRGLEATVSELEHTPNVNFVTPYLPKALSKVNNKMNLELKKIRTNEELTLDFDDLIVAYGFVSQTDFLDQWGIKTNRGLIEVNPSMQTNIPGIYGIGDAINYENRVPVIGLGFGEAQLAITAIAHNLFPEKRMTIHSTSI